MFTLFSITDVPLIDHLSFDDEALLSMSGVDRIGTITSGKVADLDFLGELDSLDDPTSEALGQILRESIARRYTLWVGAISPDRLDLLQGIFGSSICVAGPEQAVTEFTRSRAGDSATVIPVAINPSIFLETLLAGGDDRLAWARDHLEHIDSKAVSSANFQRLLSANVSIVERSKPYRLLHSPTFLAYAIVFIYSLLRALPVLFVPNFGGKVWILWGLDVVTAIPYTWGVLTLVTARTWMMRLVGLVVTIVTFVAPYMYFWSVGKGYPFYVNLIVAGFILAAIALESYRWIRDRRVAVIVRRSR